MTAANTNGLYNQVVNITADYLGPAAKRFIDRQIENHLKKSTSELKPKDLVTLAEWSRLALALLTEDKKIINEYNRRLLTLAKGNAK